MRRLTIFCLLLPVMALFINNAPPEEAKSEMVYINVHEDMVMPSKVFEYEAACKKLKKLCVDNGIQDVEWLTVSLSDFRYWHVNRISKLGDLDKDYFASLSEKIGEEELNKLWDEFDQCYTTHRNFTAALDKNLSYMPNGFKVSGKDNPYTFFQVVEFDARNMSKMKDVAKKIQNLHASVKSPLHFRMYHSGYGEMGPYLLVVTSGKDAVDVHTRMDKAREMMGEKRKEIMKEALAIMTGYSEFTGSAEPELSYGVVDIAKASTE
ncbi:MAG: hypothetical protein HKN92_11570 [Chitinophagales bacterium]|nr:hypothetical protein [Chitinophagales bacterium]